MRSNCAPGRRISPIRRNYSALRNGLILNCSRPIVRHNREAECADCIRFKAKVTDRELTPAKVRFEAVAKSNTKMSDAVEITLAVQPPRSAQESGAVLHWSAARRRGTMPENWKRGRGKVTHSFHFALAAKDRGVPEFSLSTRLLRADLTKLLGSAFWRILSRIYQRSMRAIEYRARSSAG